MFFSNYSNNVNELSHRLNSYKNTEPIYSNNLERPKINNQNNNNPLNSIQSQNESNQMLYSFSFNNNLNNKNNIQENPNENLKLKIIEKDKIIFEYMKNEKELIKKITNLNNEISTKNQENYILNKQINQLKLNNNNFQNLNSGGSPIPYKSNIDDENNNIVIKLNEEKNELINENTRLKFVIQNHENSIKKVYEQLNEKEEYINNLKKELNEKNIFVNKYDEIISDLRQDNKQIPSLKRKINDLEQIINMYKEQINELKKNNDIISYNNINYEKNIDKKNEEIYSEKTKENKLNYQLNNALIELKDTKLENSKISEKLVNIKNDSDAFIRIFINELGNAMGFLEAINVENINRKIYHIPSYDNWQFKNFEYTKLNENFKLKYEIMCTNLQKIKEKIIYLLNKGNNYWNKINEEKLAIINEEKKDFNNKENDLNKRINEGNNKIKEYEKIIENLNKDYENIKNKYIELKENFKDFSTKNDFLEKNYTNFINQIENLLKNFPYTINKEENNESNINSLQKIVIQITALINFCKELNNRLKKYNNINNINNNININKDEEIKILQDKINNLNQLLLEKEQIINKYKLNEEKLIKINNQLEKSLFSQENNIDNKNIEDNQLVNNNIKENELYPEYMCNNDMEREIKLKKILDNFDIKKKISNYCNNIEEDDILNYNYSN